MIPSKINLIQSLLILMITLLCIWLWIRVDTLEKNQPEPDEPELHTLMGNLQTYLHKLSYAAEAENRELAGFYLHELEEISEEIVERIPEYDSHPVGELTETMLLPVLEQTEASLENNENLAEFNERISTIVRSCNNCHMATDHGFIRIEERAVFNPFNQNFTTDN